MQHPLPLRPPHILFLSTGNAVRSILAEAIMRHRVGQGPSARYQVRSAGLKPLPEVQPETFAMLRAAQIPTDRLHTKSWGEFMAAAHILKMDVIVTLSEEARHYAQAWPQNKDGGPIRVHWAVDDPLSAQKADMREWKYRKCFATLDTRIAALIKTRPPASPTELLLQLKDVAMVV